MQDIELEVPDRHDVVYERQEDGEYAQVADLTEDGQRVLIAKGGLGGHGNASFATSTNRAPRKTQPGLPGEEKDLRLHLKLLADVGLVGFPNAGKSTMISRISAARPKIADYPFTTLVPNLGVVGLSGERSFVVADVPGLIEGAHAGHGLGHRFLSHLERTKVLVHLVDVSSSSGRDPVEDYDVITRELELFPGRDASGERLAEKPIVAAANKIDALDEPERLARLQAHLDELGVPLFKVSAATGEGVDALLEAVWRRSRRVARARSRPRSAPSHSAITSNEPRGAHRPARWNAGSRFISVMSKPRGPRGGRSDLDRVLRAAVARAAAPAAAARRVAATIGSRWRRSRSTASTGSRPATSNCATPGPSYTADTLTRFRERSGLGASQIFFITGADAFAEIETWHRYPEVLDLANFVVVSRPGFASETSARRVCRRCRPRMISAASRRPRRSRDRARRAPRIFLVDAPTPDVSSPTFASGCAADEPIAGLVPAAVERHIVQHGLYTDGAGTTCGRSLAWRKLKNGGPRSRRQKAADRRESRKAVRAALDKKASDVVVLDLRDTPAFTDFFVLCSGQSTRQVKAIADAVEEALRAAKVRPAHVEGYDRAEWILMDYFTFIVHVFTPQTRAFYSLERLWGDAERIESRARSRPSAR